MERLNKSYQTLLESHRALKTQNDELLVRIGLEQQFALNPILKGQQMQEDEVRTGLGDKPFGGEQGSSREEVGLVGGARR